jgi:hypothetical protein
VSMVVVFRACLFCIEAMNKMFLLIFKGSFNVRKNPLDLTQDKTCFAPRVKLDS